jgi:hypothetical protein
LLGAQDTPHLVIPGSRAERHLPDLPFAFVVHAQPRSEFVTHGSFRPPQYCDCVYT